MANKIPHITGIPIKKCPEFATIGRSPQQKSTDKKLIKLDKSCVFALLPYWLFLQHVDAAILSDISANALPRKVQNISIHIAFFFWNRKYKDYVYGKC